MLFASIKNVEKKKIEKMVSEMITKLGMDDKRGTLVRNLSGGMKRRLQLGISLIGDSKIVFLV